MTDPAVELKAAAAELATAKGTGLHLTEDEIAAYHAGTLPPDQEARAQDHLLACPVCTDLLLGLEELAGEGEPVPAGEMAASWQRMRALLPLPLPVAEPAPPLPAPLPFPPARPAEKPPLWLGALAASLLVAVVGLSVYAISLRRTVDELSGPQANTPVFDLSSDPLRGDEEEAWKLAPDDRSFVLVLSTPDSRTFPSYELKIARIGGEVVWHRDDLQRNDVDSFALILPRSLVGEGEYHIQLWGVGAAGREVLGEYDLRIVAPTGRR